MEKYIYIIILVAHIILSIIGTVRIKRTIVFDTQKKKINTWLLWLVPFIWYFLINDVISTIPGSEDMPVKNDVSSDNFHESGLGAPQAGLRDFD